MAKNNDGKPPQSRVDGKVIDDAGDDSGQQPQIGPVHGLSEAPGSPADQAIFSLSKTDLMDLIREMKKPDEEVTKKQEAERLKMLKRRTQRIKLAKQEEQAVANRQRLCRHRKPNGEETSGGQEFSDGRVRIFCLRCQKTLRSYWSPSVAQGMAMGEAMRKAGVTLTKDNLKEAMQVEGEGDPDIDFPPDFGRNVGMPFEPDLTTEHH